MSTTESKVSLPQFARSPTRASELADLRQHYRWDQQSFAPYPALSFDMLSGTGPLNGSDILLGSFEMLPEPERPSTAFVAGRIESALPFTFAMLSSVPAGAWAVAGVTIHQELRRKLRGWLPSLLGDVLVHAEQGAGGVTQLPELSELSDMVVDRIVEALADIGVAIDRRVSHVDDLIAVFNAVRKARGVAAREVRSSFVREADLVESTHLEGGETPVAAWRKAHGEGLSREVAVAALLFQTIARFTAHGRARTRDGGLGGSKTLTGYLPAIELPDPLRDDRAFARTLVAGANPVVIERVLPEVGLPEAFPVTDADLRGALRALGCPRQTLDGVTLESAIAEGRLYLTDYALLADIPCRVGEDLDFFGQFLGPQTARRRYLPAPFGLFYRDDRGLLPIAIQLGRDPGVYERFTPAEDHALWARVKMAYLSADANHQQMATHVGACHLMLAGIAIVTARQLHSDHPLGVLLRHHLEFVLFTDFIGRQFLVNERGWFEGVYPGMIAQGSMAIAARYYDSRDFSAFDFPAEVASRGVDDPALLPDYPFRDDGLALWQAMREFIGDYLRVYYREPTDLAGDVELQAWLAEMSGPQGAHLPGFPEQVESVDALADIVTGIVFRSSCFHAAVNYSQYEAYGAPERAPATLVADPREIRTRAQSDYYPAAAPWESQIGLVWVSHAQRDKTLTDYDLDWFSDERVWPLVAEFRGKLATIEAGIEARNAKAGYVYDWLRPSLVTVAANI